MLFYKSLQKPSLLPTVLASPGVLFNKTCPNFLGQYFFSTTKKNPRTKKSLWTPHFTLVDDCLQIGNLDVLKSANALKLDIYLNESKLEKQMCSPETIKNALAQIENSGICQKKRLHVNLIIQPKKLLMEMIKLSSKFSNLSSIQFHLKKVYWKNDKKVQLNLGPDEFIRSKVVKVDFNRTISNAELKFYMELFRKVRLYNSLEIFIQKTIFCDFEQWNAFLQVSIGNHRLQKFFLFSKHLSKIGAILIDYLLKAMHSQQNLSYIQICSTYLEEHQLINVINLIRKNQHLSNIAIKIMKTKFQINLVPMLHQAFVNLTKLININLNISSWIIGSNQEFVNFLQSLTQTATKLSSIELVIKFLKLDEMTLLSSFNILATLNITFFRLKTVNLENKNLVFTDSFFEKIAISIKKMQQLENFSYILPNLNQEQTPNMTPFFDAISSCPTLKYLKLKIRGKTIDENVACSLFSSVKKITKLKFLSLLIIPTAIPMGDNFIRSCISCLQSLKHLYSLQLHFEQIDASESELIEFAKACGTLSLLTEIKIRFDNASNLTFPFFQALAHSFKKIIRLKRLIISFRKNELTKDQQLLFFSQLTDLRRLSILTICLWDEKFENDVDFLMKCVSRLNNLNKIVIDLVDWSIEAQSDLSMRIKSLNICDRLSVKNKSTKGLKNQLLEGNEEEEEEEDKEESDNDEEKNNQQIFFF